MNKDILQNFAKLIGDLNEGNIGQIKSALSNSLDQVVKEQQRSNLINDNFGVLDDVFTKPQKKKINIKKTLFDTKGKLLIVMGKPYELQDSGEKKIPLFSLSNYTSASVPEDIRVPAARFENTLKKSFPTSKKFLVVHPGIPYVKSKDKFIYKTINEVVETGKRLYGIDKYVDVKENASAVINFNNLVDIFGDSVKTLCKTVNFCN